MSHEQLSIVLPVYRQPNIGTILSEHTRALETLAKPYEILVIVNGDDPVGDGVYARLESDFASVRVLRSAKGWGQAVKRGIAAASGDIVSYTNSARTRPDDLLLLLMYAISHPDAIIKANRKIRESWRRRLGSLAFNLECRALFDLATWDVNGTPKVFSRRFEKLFALVRDDDLIDAEFMAVCRREAYPVLEVPIFSTRRFGGRSTTGYGSALRMYVGAYRLWRAQERGVLAGSDEHQPGA